MNLEQEMEDVSNPLDSVEEIMSGQDWTFDRPTPDELMVHVSGRQGVYSMTFLWHEDHSALQFFCEMDLFIPATRMDSACRVLRRINEDLWLGHFDIPENRQSPCFRHTVLFKGMTQVSGAEHLRDLVEAGVAACERYHNAFNVLASAADAELDLISLALEDAAGEA